MHMHFQDTFYSGGRKYWEEKEQKNMKKCQNNTREMNRRRESTSHTYSKIKIHLERKQVLGEKTSVNLQFNLRGWGNKSETASFFTENISSISELLFGRYSSKIY